MPSVSEPFQSPFASMVQTQRNVQTRRASSWDRTGGNMDFVAIRPGQTIILADVAGAGCIKHVYFTIGAGSQRFYMR